MQAQPRPRMCVVVTTVRGCAATAAAVHRKRCAQRDCQPPTPPTSTFQRGGGWVQERGRGAGGHALGEKVQLAHRAHGLTSQPAVDAVRVEPMPAQSVGARVSECRTRRSWGA
jgi:hypothetical protein